MDAVEVPPPQVVVPGFSVAHQKVEIDVGFNEQIAGRTEITIYPDSPDLKEIRLHGRQCVIKNVLVNNIAPPPVEVDDPCDQLRLHYTASVNQHHHLVSKIAGSVAAIPEEDIIIHIPKKIRIVPVQVAEIHSQASGTIKISESQIGDASAAEATQALSDTTLAKFTPLTVTIEFESCHVPETVQFVSGKRGSGRWPHAYTRTKYGPGGASALFPCLDRINSRCTWDISIKCPRTVGDAINQCLASQMNSLSLESQPREGSRQAYESKDMLVICSGELTDVIVDKLDPTKKTVSFSCSQQLAPEQLGFAIGPFEKINLNDLRDAQEAEELGRNAVEMLAFCLPGRTEEVLNTCLPTTKAIDYIVHNYISCPFRTYCMIFVEDCPADTCIFAGVTMCSTRIIYTEDIIDRAQEVTRQIVHAIASQWIGINIVAEEPVDNWVIIGAANFITNLFMKELCGNNEYRYWMKQKADRVLIMDYERPSIYDMGALLHVDPSEYEFIALKAQVVLFILDRRIAKVTGTSKMPGILGKILTRARMGDLSNNALSTSLFQKTCERFYHAKIDDFMIQWVKGAGCPRFQAFQRFNKKKLVVELFLKQVQASNAVERELEVDNFMRDAREDFHTIYAAPQQTVFSGPMTIRIHEADGTPYEHIVEIKQEQSSFEIPYNTKYKRLKRTKKARARANAKAAAEADEEGDTLVYCLGDVLQTDEEIAEWRITEPSAEDEQKMNSESYEWIRLDADFEWICSIDVNLPGLMFVSQLQQDRDVVAQLEALRSFLRYSPRGQLSSILVRTLMDRRYFHGVRTYAARGLVRMTRDNPDDPNDRTHIGLVHLMKAFESLFCTTENGRSMTLPNDFSDQQSYLIKLAILKAIASVRDQNGHTPASVKTFLLDKVKFNDNSSNAFSDAFYIAALLRSLTEAIIARPKDQTLATLSDEDIELANEISAREALEESTLEEIDRFRRMDEWTSSYQNLYSRTALECQALLAENGLAKFSPLHFLQYTRPGNYDQLRTAAYGVLTTPTILDDPSILRYIVYCAVADASPYIRGHIQACFGRVLARRAIGERKSETSALVVESTQPEDHRAAEKARRQTMEGALSALKKELGGDEELRKAIWDAVSFYQIGLGDLAVLLDWCRMLYDTKDEAKIALKYPRYWKVEKIGPGKVLFKNNGRVRTKIVPKYTGPSVSVAHTTAPPAAPTRPSMPAPRPTLLKLKFPGQSQSNKSSPTPPPPPSQHTPSVYNVLPPPLPSKSQSQSQAQPPPPPPPPTPQAQTPRAQTPKGAVPSQRVTLKFSKPLPKQL